MKNYVQPGNTHDMTPNSGGATAGAIWKGTNVGGVYKETGPSGTKIAVAFEGVFDVVKKAAATLDFAEGEAVNILTTGGVNKAVPTTTGGLPRLGYAMVAATTGATTVRVRLCG